MKALPDNGEFQNLAADFVVVEVDTTNGKGKFNKRLGVNRNQTYFLTLDKDGNEIERMFGPNPRDSKSPELIAMMERAKLTKKGKPLHAALVAELRHKQPSRRHDAVEAIGQQGAKAVAKAVQDLVPLLRDPAGSPNVSLQTIIVLGNAGADARDAIPELLKVFHDATRKEYEKQRALSTLGRLDPKGEFILPALREALKGNDIIVIGAAMAAIELGKAAKPLEPDLEAAARRFKKGYAPNYIKRALEAIRAKK